MKSRSYLRLLLLLAALIMGAAGCNPFEWLRSRPSPTPTAPTITPAAAAQPVHMVSVSGWVEGQTASQPEVISDRAVQIVASFQPVQVIQTFDANGGLRSTSSQAWSDASVHQMRVCYSIDTPCTPGGDWLPYQDRVTYNQTVDWVGPKTLFLAAEFRDADGEVIPAGFIDQLPPQDVAQIQINTVARANPDQSTPASPQAQTAQAATQAAFPVSGSVLIKDGVCCAGGVAGSAVELSTAFTASSPNGPVNAMRVLTGMQCLRDDAALDAPWEPFSDTRIFTTTLSINWSGFFVNVQYRDAQGNLSPVYCDDIALEGSLN